MRNTAFVPGIFILISIFLISHIQTERFQAKPSYRFNQPDIMSLTYPGVYSFPQGTDRVRTYPGPAGYLHHRQRRSAPNQHSTHKHTREGRCFFSSSDSGFESFQQPSTGGDLPIFSIDPRYGFPYNMLKSSQPDSQGHGQRPQTTGPYPFTYRIVGN